jgi:eukaryotic-like serine/threonine-protein kinase
MVGQTISHYKILEKLGEGGMGVVYKAQDTKLNREVAIKFLPAHISKGGVEKERFLQEAQAVAALNHPNICVIHEINDDAEQPFIVMEYVDGSTIRTKLENGPFKIDDAIKYGIQIGEALQEAHSKGIVHRDIKADNIIINSKGQAKVMDFGLAKLKGSMKLTRTSSTVGTLAYMAPEQIQGGEVDTRSDIFAFAVLFFEMLAGRLPFRGEHEAAMMYSIINEEPEEIQKFVPEISGEIVHTLGKALEKDPENRYQSIQEMVVDLRRSKKDTSRVGRLSGASQNFSSVQGTIEKSFDRPSKKTAWIGIAALTVIAIGVILYFTLFKGAASPLPPMKIVNFTSYSGYESAPAFSPDGKSIAFDWNGQNQDNVDIYVKLIGAGSPLRLTTDPASDLYPAWSPDGRYIAFLRSSSHGTAYYIVPSLGGEERKVAEVKYSSNRIDWSPDGKTLAVSASDSSLITSIMLISVDTGIKRILTTPNRNALGSYGDNSPKYSSDGTKIAYVKPLSFAVSELFVIPSSGGTDQRITYDSVGITSVDWIPGTNEIAFASNRSGSTTIWRISSQGGSIDPVTGAGENVSDIDVSASGNMLAYSRQLENVNIWEIGLNTPGSTQILPKEIITSSEIQMEPQYSPDGKYIAFTSNRSGSRQIWRCNRDGSNPVQLTSIGGSPGTARWSPDGNFIAFDAREKGNGDVYVVSVNGGSSRQVTFTSWEENIPSWSRDGKWIYFSSNRTGKYQIWKMPAEGGEAVQVTKEGGLSGFESPDGKYLYFVREYDNTGIMKMPVGGGDEQAVNEKILNHLSWGAWALAEKGIYFIQEDSKRLGHIYFYDFKTNKEKPLMVTQKPVWLYSGKLDVSPDGRSLIFVQVDQNNSDIILVQNFR